MSPPDDLMPISASMLYNHVRCEHRVTMDRFGPIERRDEISAFVRLLWERGTLYEKDVIGALKRPFTDLSALQTDAKEAATREAMSAYAPLIYGGRLVEGDLIGEPDLLRLEGAGYVPGDIKSGAGEEGPADARKLKRHYALQLAHYVHILELKGESTGRTAFVWDIHGEEVPYQLDSPVSQSSPTTWWQGYQRALESIRKLTGLGDTRPAATSACKECCWYTACMEKLRADDDPTLIPELGRARRDALAVALPTVAALANANLAKFQRGRKTIFPRIGPETLADFKRRAQLLCTPKAEAYLSEPARLPINEREVFFDIEADPLRDLCYLHGFLVRERGQTRYTGVFSGGSDVAGEREAFAEALQFLRGVLPASLYYYAPYEKTTYRRLAERYPDVATPDEIEALFADPSTVDLYTQVIRPLSYWPTYDHSIKTLAKYLGFRWRDSHPSGAASIEWYDQLVKSGNPGIKARIVEYNEDDCQATAVLLDGIRRLPVKAV